MGTTKNNTPILNSLTVLVLAGLVAYGAYLRLHDSTVSLYDTEIDMREQATERPLHLLATEAAPLYPILARATLALGDTEVALRLPSLVAGLLSILALYGLVAHLHSRVAGLVAAALLTFNPYHITTSQFAEPGSLLILWTLLLFWFLSLLLEEGRWYAWPGFVLSALLAVSSDTQGTLALFALTGGGILFLLARRGHGTLLRRLGVAVLLVICAGVALGNLAEKRVNPFQRYQFSPAGVVESVGAATVEETRPKGGGRPEVIAESGATRYRLTVFDCMEYLKRYFWNTTWWLWAVLIAMAVWGMVDLCFRVPAAGVPLVTGLIGMPGLLFLATADYPYHPRDFSPLFVLALIAVAVGTCVMPHFVSRVIGAPRSLRLWRRVPVPAAPRRMTLANVLFLLIVAGAAVPLAPIVNRAYQTYPVYGYLPSSPTIQNKAPVRDWKNLFQDIAAVAGNDDQFIFMTPDTHRGPRYARYYLSRFANEGLASRAGAARFAAASPELIRELGMQYPLASHWFLGYQSFQAGDFGPLFQAAGAVEKGYSPRNTSDELKLYALGAPTTNLMEDAGLERTPPAELPEGVALELKYPYAGKKGIRVEQPLSTEGGTFFRAPVTSAAYRLRNSGFSAWQGDQPVGWDLNDAARAAAGLTADGKDGSPTLRLAPGSSVAILRQPVSAGLAPGRTVTVSAAGRCDGPNNLYLVLHYAGPGFQVEEQVAHPGGGTWEPMVMQITLPAETDPASIVMEIWRTAGGTGDALVDDVTFAVEHTGVLLEPMQPYVLSLAIRSSDLRSAQGATAGGAGRVRLVWEDETGQAGHYDLLAFEETPSWRLVSAPFVAGRDVPAALATLGVAVGIAHGTGTVWLDNLQLEAGSRPTPFTPATRLPHDEVLGAIDLAPFAVPVTW